MYSITFNKVRFHNISTHTDLRTQFYTQHRSTRTEKHPDTSSHTDKHTYREAPRYINSHIFAHQIEAPIQISTHTDQHTYRLAPIQISTHTDQHPYRLAPIQFNTHTVKHPCSLAPTQTTTHAYLHKNRLTHIHFLGPQIHLLP